MSYRIFLVDDNDDLRFLLTALLSESGHEVIGEAENGAVAIAKLEALANPPDLIILDMSMPVMDGLQVLESLHNSSYPSEVVVLTGFNELGLRRQARALGAKGYIEKGAQIIEIGSMIESVIQANAHDAVNYD